MITRALLLMLPDEAAGDLLEEAPGHSHRWLLWQTVRSLAWCVAESWHRGDIAAALAASLGGVLLPLLALDRLWAFVYSQIPLRDGLQRAPWMLLLNLAVAGTLAWALRCRGTGFLMPLAGAAGWWLGLADAGVWYGFQLIGLCLLAGRKWR